MATLHRLDPTRVELEVAIPDEDLEKARDKAYRQLVRNTKIPGFRPGKAPRRIFEQQYGTLAIEERAIEDVFPRIYTQALEEHGVHPLERPTVDWLPRESPAQPLRFKATVSVRPQIELGDYAAITLDVTVPDATDAEVNEALERLQRETATLIPVERAAMLGDAVVIDYRGTIDGEAFAGGTAQGQQVDLLEERFIPGFAKGIEGLTAGESRSIEAVFPEGYFEANLAGKTAVFEVTLHEVKEHELPALDDEFAAKFLPESPTLDAMKTELRKRIRRTNEMRIKNEQADPFLEKLLALHTIALPELLVTRELEAALRTRQLEAAQAGKAWPEYLAEQKTTEEVLRVELLPEAERRVKTMLVIEEIARKEQVTASPAEIDAEIGDLAAQYGQTKQRVREALGSELHGLADGIVRSKALDLLLDRALGIKAETAVPA